MSSMALRNVARAAAAVSAAPRRAITRPGMVAAMNGLRYASSTPAKQDPKSRAAALIDALPGNSVVSKTGWITLGTALTGLGLSKELLVVNEEVVVAGSFFILIAYLSTLIRTPYSEWADGQIAKFKDILNNSRTSHTQAVQTRIDSMAELKNVEEITNQLFALSKETAQLEHETFTLKQKAALASEVKATLDSWVRFEAQQRESEQAELVKSIQEKVLASLKDPKSQKDILAQAVSDLENLVKSGKL